MYLLFYKIVENYAKNSAKKGERGVSSYSSGDKTQIYF
jgi:hypothetical protein